MFVLENDSEVELSVEVTCLFILLGRTLIVCGNDWTWIYFREGFVGSSTLAGDILPRLPAKDMYIFSFDGQNV